MAGSKERSRRILALTDAFAGDGFEVVKIVNKFNRIGIAAESKSVINYDTGRRKKAYYLEGSGYETGFLLGMLAEAEISSMAVEFTDKVVFSFIGSKLLQKIKLLQEAFILLVYELSKKAFTALPSELKDEIQGLYDGCISVNPHTRVSMEHLIVLNLGIDILCSIVYTGNLPLRSIPDLKPEDLKVPFMCNAFSISGKSAGNNHFFGRDFMFPTADIFQNTAAMIIYGSVPQPTDQTFYGSVPQAGRNTIPFVSVTAPGMVGSISAMNIYGTAAGVDMSPAANCEPQRIGANSLLLVRLCIQGSQNTEEAVKLIGKTQRGVSWNYIIADGTTDRACVVEAGCSGVAPDITQVLPEDLKPFLPQADISGCIARGIDNGMSVRWNDYKYPVEYLKYNPALWSYYNKKHSTDKRIYLDAFSSKGFINMKGSDKNCPSVFYFAPQREANDDILLVTNHFIVPCMRYYSMHAWTSRLIGDIVNDVQWRYDELNSQMMNEIDNRGYIDYQAAKSLISFLSPYGRNASYYSTNPKSSDGKELRIEGCTSLFDLKKLTVESHYGYYRDEWVKLTLPNYFFDSAE